jgi:hypothetical protein
VGALMPSACSPGCYRLNSLDSENPKRVETKAFRPFFMAA